MNIIAPALKLFAALSIVLGLIYPIVVTGVAQILFPKQASGSLIYQNSKLIGSELIGQTFTDNQYFWSRPSATAEYPYNATASAGSNLAPSNPALKKSVSSRVAQLTAQSSHPDKVVPIDLVTYSASGLDPEISINGALYQVDRVSKARGLPKAVVKELINKQAQMPVWKFGEPRVNVLLLNLHLDQLKNALINEPNEP